MEGNQFSSKSHTGFLQRNAFPGIGRLTLNIPTVRASDSQHHRCWVWNEELPELPPGALGFCCSVLFHVPSNDDSTTSHYNPLLLDFSYLQYVLFFPLSSMFRYTLAPTVVQPTHFATPTGIASLCLFSMGQVSVQGELPLWWGNHSRCLVPFRREESIFFLWNSCFITLPAKSDDNKEKTKNSLATFLTLFFFLSPSVFLPFKCILSTVHDHLENINNHFRTQMPSHWEFPNWVMPQSAAHNHTHGLGRLPRPAAETQKDSEVSNWEVCCFRKYLFCPPSNFPFAGIFHWSWKTHGRHLSANNYLSLCKTSTNRSAYRDSCKTKHRLCLFGRIVFLSQVGKTLPWYSGGDKGLDLRQGRNVLYK